MRLHIGQVSRKAEVYARIIKTGMPSFCRQSLASVATVLLNVNAAVYGDAAVAAMSVVGRIFMFVFSFMLGFGDVYKRQPQCRRVRPPSWPRPSRRPPCRAPPRR